MFPSPCCVEVKSVSVKFMMMGLLKNAHLLCCAANRTAERLSIYASRFCFLRASHLNIFEQPPIWGIATTP
jgi:hypothetical protein